jgi:hypothetical protein
MWVVMHWSACIKPWMWVVMYLCAKRVSIFISFNKYQKWNNTPWNIYPKICPLKYSFSVKINTMLDANDFMSGL